ncbi:MAG: hypothetical protein ACOC8E_02270 [Planctomycetota bacterium]
MRYNRLIDVFLGIVAYSLQNHLRTYVTDMGQVEVDELYAGVNRQGAQFIVPVQAKGSRDRIGSVQSSQDLACCAEKFPDLVCRPVAAQFVADDLIAMCELAEEGGESRVVDEKHYQLVPADQISKTDLKRYREMKPGS